jgi:glucose/arabinose dehydrogenase
MTQRIGQFLACAIAMAIVVPGAAAAQDQSPQPPASSPPQAAQPATPAPPASQTSTDLDRVKAQLQRPPTLKLDEDQLRFYVEVVAKQPSIADLIGSYDLINGATKGGAVMTHQEFLNMVTPRDFYGSGGIKSHELLQFALTNWLGQQVIKRALEDIRNARTEREVQEIRQRIERELAALKGGGE